MKTFAKFLEEAYSCEAKAYDAAFMSGAQVIRTGEGGRIGRERTKSEPERKRTKRGPGGTTLPAKPYKPRKDIGTPRAASTRVQEPTQERGSASVRERAAAAAKEERRKAALARRETAKSGGEAPKSKPKDLEKQATKILSTKKPKAPESKGEKDERTTKYQYTRDEKKKMVRAGKRLHADIIKGRDRPAADYQP